MSHDIFISYASEEEEVAIRIVGFLRGQGLACWIDKEGIRPGREFDTAIERAIREAYSLIWIASQRSAAKDYVKFEIATAHHHSKPIIPLFLEKMDVPSLPTPFRFHVEKKQGIELFVGSESGNLTRLVDEVQTIVRSCRRKRIGIKASSVIAVVALCVGAWGILTRFTGWQPIRGSRPESTSIASAAETMPPPRVLPASVAEQPAADVLQIAYTGFPPQPPTDYVHPQVQMDVLGRRAGDVSFVALNDGDPLASEVDNYVIAARVLATGYIYLFQVDTAGKKEWLFPENDVSQYSCGSNPVSAGLIFQIPSEASGQALYLDTTIGVEHIYLVFSATRWPELERALGSRTPLPSKRPSFGSGTLVQKKEVQEPNGMKLRGVGGMRVDEATDEAHKLIMSRLENGRTVSFSLQSAPYVASGPLLVVERWFHHVTPK